MVTPPHAAPRPLTVAGIAHTASQIPPPFRDSPQFVSEGLSRIAGRRVLVKCEAVNPAGCFKVRGTWAAVDALVAAGLISPERGVVAATAGNFGIGLAYVARAFGIPATIFVAEGANPRKVERIALLGARLVVEGRDGDEALEAAERFAQEHDLHFLKDGTEPLLAVGAGTLALEVTAAVERGELPPIDAVYVPTGGGSLLAGVGTWFRSASPATRVAGVQPENAPALTLSWREKRYVETATCDTCADGLAMRRPIREALALLEGAVDEMILVSEEELRRAQAYISSELGIAVEPSAAASLAGLLQSGEDGEGSVLLLVTGSNVAVPPRWH